MFGKGKKKQEEIDQPVVKAKTPFEIGKDGTVEELCAANDKAKNKMGGAYDLYYMGGSDQRELQNGAIEAFKEGRTDNLQCILANPAKFMVCDHSSFYPVDSEKIFDQLIKGVTTGSDDQATIITLAMDKFPEQSKQACLDGSLLRAVTDHYYGDDLVAALLKAGAGANAEVQGFKGFVLAKAIESVRMVPTIELLYKAGANFDDALFCIQANKWDEANIRSLKAYREKVTGKPSTIEVAPEVLQQLLDQVAEITKRLPPAPTPVKSVEQKRFPTRSNLPSNA